MRALILLMLLAFTANYAQAVELSGSYRNLFFHHKDSRNQSVISDLNRLRLNLDGGEQAWLWKLSYDQELLYGGVVRDPIFGAQQKIADSTWLDLSANIVHAKAVNWRHDLYRGWLEYEKAAWNVKLGRQRIAWGSGRIWNPSDRFNAVQPTVLEADQKLGVDAVYITYAYDDFASVQGVFSPKQLSRSVQRKWALRWQDTIAQTDMSLWLGEIGQEKVLAVDVTGNIGEATGRVEWQQSWHGSQGDFGQFIVGLDGTWHTPLLSDGLYLAVEYFYNGAVSSNTIQWFKADYLQSRSKQLLGMLTAYDVTPLWKVSLTSLADLEKNSWFMSPSLAWSVRSDMDATLFSQFSSGQGAGEFANLNSLLGLKLEYYF